LEDPGVNEKIILRWIILQCIMCIYIHIHAVETQQLTDGISIKVQYTTTCFGLINGPSSGCW
jgi:hypothetical protein